MTGVEFPELLESEATPGLVVPDAVLIPETVLRAQGRDRAGGTQGMGNSPKDASGTPSGGDILPPETPRPPTTARRVAAGIVLVAIAVGLGLMLSIALVLAVAWMSSSVMDYFQS